MFSTRSNTQSLLDRIATETKKEQAKADELKLVLEAKRKLVEARNTTQQLRKDIDSVGHPEQKKTRTGHIA